MSFSGGDNDAVVLQVVVKRQAKHGGWRRFEIIEKLVLKAVEDADEKVLVLDWFARAVVKGYDHRGFVCRDGRLSYGLLRLFGHHTSSHEPRRTSGRRVRADRLTICLGR